MPEFPRNIAILGSTGSVGRQALDVIRNNPHLFRVNLLTANHNDELLADQIAEFEPDVAVVVDSDSYSRLKGSISGTKTKIECGDDSLLNAVSGIDSDVVLNAIVGFAGLRVSFEVVSNRRILALANKESLVSGGELLMKRAAESGVEIIPVDSEHSAIFQCLKTGRKSEVRRIILTASGGPFLDTALEDFASITPAQALDHPNWDMGPKISIDSATMMNKVLEIIEARWLFDVKQSKIDVVIHPQSIVHSMVEFVDSTVIAQMSPPDMRIPIQYALGWPQRIESVVKRLNLSEVSRLTFQPPDSERFPALKLADTVLSKGGSSGAILNAANEIAVETFLAGRIRFDQVVEIVNQTLELIEVNDCLTVDDIVNSDLAARKAASELVIEKKRKI